MSEEQLEDAVPTESAGKKKKKGGSLMAVVAAVIAASGGAFAGISFLGPSVGETLATSSQEASEGSEYEGGQEGGEYGSPSNEVEVHVINDLVVNPAGSGATRFLLASVAISPGENGSVSTFETRDIELRDALLRLLGSKTVDELADIQLRAALTEEMIAVLDGLLGEGYVGQVFLPQFVIQ